MPPMIGYSIAQAYNKNHPNADREWAKNQMPRDVANIHSPRLTSNSQHKISKGLDLSPKSCSPQDHTKSPKISPTSTFERRCDKEFTHAAPEPSNSPKPK